jgi:ABC-type spermidine/putrescine transport system permease subunit I
MPKGFRRFLASAQGKAIFRAYGFGANSISPEEWGIIWLSLKVSMAAMVVTLPIGFALAWALARGGFRARCCWTGWCICRWSCRRW